MDSLLSVFQLSSADEVPAIFEFMKTIYQLIFKWLESFPSYLTAYQEAQHHPQLYLVNMEACISMCGNELFCILEKCFGRCYRSIRFFQKYPSEVFVTEGENNFAAKDKMKNNGLMASFLNAFGNMKGFEKVLSFICFEVKDSR